MNYSSINNLLDAAMRAEASKDYFLARKELASAIHLVKEINVDKKPPTPIDPTWFERMAGWSGNLNQPEVGLIYLQRAKEALRLSTKTASKQQAGKDEEKWMEIHRYLFQFSCGLKKHRVARKYHDLFMASKAGLKEKIKYSFLMLEMLIKLQIWEEAKQLLEKLDNMIDKKTAEEVTVDKDWQTDALYQRDKFASFYYLGVADYDNGFACYEHRHQKNFEKYFMFKPHHHATPRWQGEPLEGLLKGKALLVAAEQGFGDVVMFCRFLPLLKKLAGSVVLQMPQSLIPLLSASPCCAGITLIDNRATPPPIGAWVLIQSLPFFIAKFLGQDALLPFYQRSAPYLAVNNPMPAHLSLPKTAGKKNVGIVWATNVQGHEWQTRTLHLKQFLPLLRLANINVVSLQVGEASQEIEKDNLSPFITNGALRITNFADTAYFINQLDILVSVDTVVSHVSGGLMKPTLVIVPKKNDWRWGRTNESFWYPGSHQVIRQSQDGQWQDVMATVVDKIKQL